MLRKTFLIVLIYQWEDIFEIAGLKNIEGIKMLLFILSDMTIGNSFFGDNVNVLL